MVSSLIGACAFSVVIILSFLYIRFSGLPFYWLLLLCLSSAVIRAFLIIRKAGVKDAA